MNKMVLIFPTEKELLDFKQAVDKKDYLEDRQNLSIVGIFEEPEIELARNGFDAVIVGQ
jgi:hypothetical protein